ncbi:MAG: YbaK/EbsC family protein [Chloroflexi bacterium]|nr:YbaK/EbsC family protein [Chloroflexota bacterium]MBI3762724.1 YbaK/EbsC family protein [Chloroflexota bacterium]
MANVVSPAAQKVQAILREAGFDGAVRELPQSTRTAPEAAQAVGCDVGQIVKSIVFRAADSNRPILVVASGANRVNEKAIGDLIGEPLAKADADFVRARTGFVIGGVPPMGHSESIQTFIDEDLMNYAEIWAAAGTPNALFRLTPGELVRLTGGRVTKTK